MNVDNKSLSEPCLPLFVDNLRRQATAWSRRSIVLSSFSELSWAPSFVTMPLPACVSCISLPILEITTLRTLSSATRDDSLILYWLVNHSKVWPHVSAAHYHCTIMSHPSRLLFSRWSVPGKAFEYWLCYERVSLQVSAAEPQRPGPAAATMKTGRLQPLPPPDDVSFPKQDGLVLLLLRPF